MDTTTLLDFCRVAHFVGIALALGPAIQADMLALRALRRPLDQPMLAQLWRLHGLIVFGLGLLWVSGLAVAWHKTGFHPESISPKLATKFVIVTLLTGNAMLMEAVALPILRSSKGLRLGDLPVRSRLALGAIGGLSAGFWASALALGGFSQLKPMPFADLLPIIGGVVVTAMVGGVLMALFAAPRFVGSTDTAGPVDQGGAFALRR